MVAFCGFQAGAARVQTFAGLAILRFITAVLGGPVLAVGGASVADMYNPLAIPVMLAIWVIPAFSGPGLGPVFANPAAQAHGWRWTMYEVSVCDLHTLTGGPS
jgi:DHA1 family multidrug resistance protein-like MFS transporter